MDRGDEVGVAGRARSGSTGRGPRARSPRSSGRRASQTRRPCQIRRCGKRAQSARGTIFWRSRSILTGSSWRVSPSRCESRRTCVSTTMPCAWPSSAATTFAVLRATPGSRMSSSSVRRNLAVELLEQHVHRPADRLRLLPEEAGRVDVPLELLLRDGEVVLGLAVLLEQPLGHAVDVRVRRLRREHHRDEELEIRAEAERDLRVRVLLGEPLDDRPDPLPPPPEPAPARLADVATRHGARPRSARSSRPPSGGSSSSVRYSLGDSATRRIAATAASTSYSVRRSSTSGPSKRPERARRPSNGMPTLPALTTRGPFGRRGRTARACDRRRRGPRRRRRGARRSVLVRRRRA